MKRLVLLSGGLDSTTVLGLAAKHAEKEGDKIVALSLNYGQRHHWELHAAKKVVGYYGDLIEKHEIVNIPLEVFQGPNAGFLVNHGQEVPNKSYAELEGVSPSYVPNRNAVLISIATARALGNDCGEVWCGVHSEDAANYAYPDCTPEFIGAMANAINQGTYFKVRLVAPLQYMMKEDVVRAGFLARAPLHLTRSCYAETERSCGKCPTCISRLEAFKSHNFIDLIDYAEGVQQ